MLGINDDPVTIKSIEKAIIDRAFDEGWIAPQPAGDAHGQARRRRRLGPSGLAAAHQLNRAGHCVTVFERDDRIGGLLRYGIPDFKMEKHFLERRLAQMPAEGVVFRTGVTWAATCPLDELRREFDAVVLAVGSTLPRDLRCPGAS